jgi:hypothetical protein
MTAICTAFTCDITDVAATKAKLVLATNVWASGNFPVYGVVGNRLYFYKVKP